MPWSAGSADGMSSAANTKNDDGVCVKVHQQWLYDWYFTFRGSDGCLLRINDRWRALIEWIDGLFRCIGQVCLNLGRRMRWRRWCYLLPFRLGFGACRGFSLGLSLAGCWLGGIGTQWLNTLDPCRCAGLLLHDVKFCELSIKAEECFWNSLRIKVSSAEQSYRWCSSCGRWTLKE